MGAADGQKASDDRRLSSLGFEPAWICVYAFAILVTVTFLRSVVWLVTGGRGAVAASVAWLTDPFVYVFNHSIGLPTFSVGSGKIETGSILAVAAYTAVGFAVWMVFSRGMGYVTRLLSRGDGTAKDETPKGGDK